ncbi:ROK family protein [Yinghuangia sp. ASG 101]|uniref:ROK family protein n=1 Tax=Yinghuangia sp. ASG 101 TaxID=2896848 RepID=UPI001E5ACCEF|nr:ROK family protein [Yinghuangia sp. ASG 101]UGQ12778.1 ROK family protein [Yinghuangia sp. ASG 101]
MSAPDISLPRPNDARPTGRLAIGIDVGGTKIACGVVTASGEIVRQLRIPTPPGADETTAALLDLVARLRDEYPGAEAVGVGAAGMVEWPRGLVRWAPNNAYQELPLQELLSERTGLAAVVENDANAAAWAEATVGRGAGHRDIIVLTLGTGIGGGLILDGSLYRGHTGIGAEVGHLIVSPEGGARCGCGATGCLEAQASGIALGRMAREAAAADPSGVIATLAGETGEPTGETVHAAALQGDAVARDLFDRLGFWLGAGIASLVNLFDPEIVVLGGSLGATGDLLFVPATASFERFVMGADRRTLPPIVPASLGNEAGLVGAALLALGTAPAGSDTRRAVEASH